MARKRYCPNSEVPYHITARCINREWFTVPMDEVWSIFSRYLFFIHHAYHVRIHAFVLMNNHYHLILQTPRANLAEAMNYFQGETSRQIATLAKRINQVYGAPYYWSLLTTDHYFRYAYKYVYRNPVDAGVCTMAEAYKYSTLNALVGISHTTIPLIEDINLFSDTECQLNWINAKYPDNKTRDEIRQALHRKEFKFPKDRTRKPHPFDLKML